MTIGEGAALLHTPRIDWTRRQTWCDLGCGAGLFTMALATLLSSGSIIYAIDKNRSALDRIRDEHEGVSIRKIEGDLNDSKLQLPSTDGMLMANALHFIPRQEDLLRRLLAKSQRFLVVEYERSQSSRWGPYPVTFHRLQDLFQTVSIESVVQIGERKSRFGGRMYSALAETGKI